MWRAIEFGDRQYFHAIGFNREEYTRIKRDKAYTLGGRRIPTYPIYLTSFQVQAVSRLTVQHEEITRLRTALASEGVVRSLPRGRGL
jgi:hypothetical protein